MSIIWDFRVPKKGKPDAQPQRYLVSDPHDYDKDAQPYKIHADADHSLPRRRKRGENPKS